MRPDTAISGLLWEESEDEGRLGAARVEVLELGRAAGAAAVMGQLGDIGAFLAGALQTAVDFLAKIIGTPLDLVAQGASWVIDRIAAGVGVIPGVGDLLGQAVTMVKVIINAGLHLPENLLKAASNLIGSFSKLPEKQQKGMVEKAVGQVMQLAKAQGKEKEVGQLIKDNPPVVGGEAVAGAAGGPSGLAKVAVGLGVPAALAAGAALVA